MEDFIKNVVREMVSNPDALQVSVVENQGAFQVKINVDAQDCGIVVGKGGGTIKAIRDLAGVFQKKQGDGDYRRIFISVNEE